jgi:hypothetical protein
VEISVSVLIDEITHAYPEKTVHLKFFICKLLSGEPKPLGCAAFRWVDKAELAEFDFPAADNKILQRLDKADSWGCC